LHLASETLTYCLLSDIEDELLLKLITSFSCRNHTISRYLKEEAYFDHYEFAANTTLVFSNEKFVAYFTLQQGVIESDINGFERRCLIIERLGVQAEHQKQGIGSSILQFIVALAEMFNQRYITIDSVWEYREFYYNRGFRPFIEKEYEESNDTGLVYMFMDLYDEEKVNNLYNNP